MQSMVRAWVALVVAVVAGLGFAGAARADAPVPTVVETHGVEIEVPVGWTVTAKTASVTAIMPAKYKGRGIEIIEANQALSKDFIAGVVKAAGMARANITTAQRNGAPIIAATGAIAVAGKGDVDVDILGLENAAHHAVLLTSYIKADQDPILRDANDKLLLSARVAGPKLTLVVERPRTAKLVGYPAEVVTLLGTMGSTLDKLFRFPRALPIKVTECGVVNAFYSPTDHAIIMCHEFWDDTLALFTAAGFDAQQAMALTRGTVMFAFFHEFGHALVGEFGLPITGKGEDAADEIATIFLSQASKFGRETALAGATWFRIMAAQPTHHNVFWDEHSFDDQRVVSIACLLYGSDKATYAPVMTQLQIPAQRQARCVRDYADRLAAWNSLIEPHMRSPLKK